MIKFLLPTGRLGASSRYRVYQYKKIFDQYGMNYEFNSFMDDKMYSEWKSNKKITLIFKTLSMFLKRIIYVLNIKKNEIIFIHRDALPFGPMILEWYIKKKGCKLIVDLDDAIFSTDIGGISNSKNRVLYRLKYGKRFDLSFKLASKVICGNEYIENYVKKFNLNTTIIPTTIDMDSVVKYRDKKYEKDEYFSICWIGNPGNTPYIIDIINYLNYCAEQEKLKLRVILIGADKELINTKCNTDKLKVEFYKWSESTEYQIISQVDIGIMPLPDDEWAKGKCGLKALQYLAMGKPAIISNVGENKKIIKNGINGYLVDDLKEWGQYIKDLYYDRQKLNDMRVEAVLTVKKHYSMERWGNILIKNILK